MHGRYPGGCPRAFPPQVRAAAGRGVRVVQAPAGRRCGALARDGSRAGAHRLAEVAGGGVELVDVLVEGRVKAGQHADAFNRQLTAPGVSVRQRAPPEVRRLHRILRQHRRSDRVTLTHMRRQVGGSHRSASAAAATEWRQVGGRLCRVRTEPFRVNAWFQAVSVVAAHKLGSGSRSQRPGGQHGRDDMACIAAARH